MPDIKAQNETALASVKAIYEAAEEANTLLDGMQTAAEQAGTTLDGIYADAQEAKSSAESATASANTALDQLSIVENVVGVLDLVAKNGTYALTTDTEVQPDKWYFTQDGYAGGSYSGSIVTFNSTAGNNITDLTVDIEPIQDLNGYDKPWVGGAGKNKLDTSGMSTAGQSGVTFSRASDGVITVGGKANTTVYRAIGSIKTVSGVQYTITGVPSGGASGKYRMTVVGYGYDYGSGYTFTGDGNSHDISIDIYTGYPSSGTLTFKPMIRLASDTDATYEPYSNICPISGRTEVVTQRAGKNLYEALTSGGRTNSGITWTYNADGSLTASGTATGNSWSYATAPQITLPSGTYTASVSSPFGLVISNVTDGGNIYNGANSTHTFTITKETRIGIYARVANGTTINQTTGIMLEVGSSASEWQPYNGKTYTTALGRTVYGGTLDVVSGVLTVTHKLLTCDSSISVGFNGSTSTYSEIFVVTSDKAYGVSNMISNICECQGRATNANIYCRVPTSVTNAAQGKQWLIDNGAVFVYELATPQTYQLTAQQISTLLGENNLWANSGDVSVTVRSTYSYEVVNNPTGDPSAQGWYELTGIDQAIQNYVSSHLVLTNNGLSLRTDGSNYRLDLTTTGMNIIGANGQTLASYGTSTVVGDVSGFHVQIDGTELGFYQGSNRVAYINGNRLYITQSVVLQQMDVGTQVSDGGLGQWSWKVHEVNGANNLYLKWLG